MIESAYLVGYILVKVPLGYLANKLGAKRILLIGMIGYGTASALFIFASSYSIVLLLRFLVGFFQGIHLPVANALLSERFGSRQGRASGRWSSAGRRSRAFSTGRTARHACCSATAPAQS